MTKDRVYNFSAGPAVLPEDVLIEAAKDMLNYNNCGMSVMEMSHRSKEFEAIILDAERRFRQLMNIPNNYKVLFLQGGATTQFSMIPLNLLTKHKKAAYLDTGSWSTKALKEATKYGEVVVVASSKDQNYSYIPKLTSVEIPKDIDYFHITTNNTIYGTRIAPKNVPDTQGVPLIADMSSNILSEEYDISKFSLIYAGAQKNIGPAGVTVVIIKDELIGNAADTTPLMLDYKTHSEKNSLYNTPPCYSIYICGLVFKWLQAQGGIKEIEKINKHKAQLLYSHLSDSKMFSNPVSEADRSLMNVTFVTGDKDLDALFVKEAAERGFVNLKGHRSVGGMRASIYNAMPVEGVEKLIEFMKDFEIKHR